MKKDQFHIFYEANYSEGLDSLITTQVFELFDIDHDGKLDFIEFFIACKGDSRQKLKILFQMFDKDNCGNLRKKELEEALNTLANFTGDIKSEDEVKKKVSYLFSSFDKDQSGALTEDEFVNGCFNDNGWKIFPLVSFNK